MPVDHTKNRENAQQVDAIKSATKPTLVGRTTKYPISEVAFESFCKKGLGGDNFKTIVTSIVANDEADLIKGFRQPTNHNDDTGNLPVAPGGQVVYREYFVSANKFTTKGYPRLVADLKNKRLYITPTHYDTWYEDSKGLKNPRNAFFLLRGVAATNALFD